MGQHVSQCRTAQADCRDQREFELPQGGGRRFFDWVGIQHAHIIVYKCMVYKCTPSLSLPHT